MKKLILIRHGKSSWEFNVRDHDRPLLQRGIEDAHKIGLALKDIGLAPDAINSSPAARALQTASIISEYIDYDLNLLSIHRSLYTFDYVEQKDFINRVDDSIKTLVIVSHNHGLTDLANHLGTQRFDNIPTTGVVCIEFDVNKWSLISKGTTIFNIFTKNL